MRLKRAIFSIGLLAALVLTILTLSPLEPRYQGRPLTSWLQQYSDSSFAEPAKYTKAEEAIRAMPVKRVVPRLLRLVQARDNGFTPWVRKQGDERNWPVLQWRLAEEKQLIGIAGFEVLGTNAASAAGKLTKLLDDPAHAFTAARCLGYIGKAAEPGLCKGLTNQDVQVRELSIYALASVTATDEEYINRVKSCLKDASGDVRCQAVSGIGAQTGAPEAVPLLITALDDPSDEVSAEAAGDLKGFGTNALVAFAQLKNLAENGGENAARAAMTTLAALAPDRAVPILTNAVTRGGLIAFGALTTLISISPDTAQPILLNQAQSQSDFSRQQAVMLLCKYPVKTPEIQWAIERAAADSNSMISRSAKEFLTEQYRQTHPHEAPFSGEPVYKGKTLGEWLDMHDSEGNFTSQATNALQRMGTNAIPALLNRLAYRLPPVNLPAYQTNLDAAKGFVVLGAYAIPAIPRLESLMDVSDKDVGLLAMVSAMGTGSNAIPVLLKGLTNRFDEVRGEAINNLTQFGSSYPDQRRAAIPLLKDLLQDTNEDVRMSASNALKEIDSHAASGTRVK